MFEDAELISCYSRQDAIDDGLLISLSDLTKDPQILGTYKYPICLTDSVFGEIREDLDRNKHKELNGILWDIVSMSHLCVLKRISESIALFAVRLNDRDIVLKIQCHASDDFSPCITIMGKDED